MKLDESQLKQVAGWFAAGERLADIQRRISEEFGIDLTYLDVRLLVADLPPPPEKPEPAEEKPAAGAEPPADPESWEGADPSAPETAEDAAEPPPGALGSVEVSLSPIALPGALASGSVTFSDGTSGKWYLDDLGRLGLGDLPEGYRPPSADSPVFQQKLFSLLRSKGLA